MKKTAIVILSFLMISFTFSIVNAKNSENLNETVFQSSTFAEALALAKSQNKPLLLDISASWCGYCKRMKKNVYTDPEVGMYLNSNFISLALDGEVGEGAELAKKYEVKAYPTFVFLNPDGSLLYKTAGYHSSKEFLILGKSVADMSPSL